MQASRGVKWALLAGAAMLAAIPVLAQDSPESLLPPGFGSPAPSQADRPAPSPAKPREAAPPKRTGEWTAGTGADAPASAAPAAALPGAGTVSAAKAAKTAEEEEDKPRDVTQIRFDVPPGAVRSLDQVGLIGTAEGGAAADAFGRISGKYLLILTRNVDGPLASRWGTIMARRMLASRIATPTDIGGADWVAERSRLLLGMGEATTARALIQQVDAGRYNKALYSVAMPIYLANADPAGSCPLVGGANNVLKDPNWRTMRGVCAGLAGEQAQAMAFLRESLRRGWASSIDYLLAEKAIGASGGGGRAVKIEWDKVKSISDWRQGMALNVGLVPPDTLYGPEHRVMRAWMATAPMLNIADRMRLADDGAATGVLSNAAMVSIYAMAMEEQEGGDVEAMAEALRAAYVAQSRSEQLSAMRTLWSRKGGDNTPYAMQVLTARAAALLPAADDNASDIDALIGSMFAAGLDVQAAKWSGQVDEGSLAWALLAVGSPRARVNVNEDAMRSFMGGDSSDRQKKSRLLLAGLAGLARLGPQTYGELAAEMDVNLTRKSAWSNAIERAAARGEQGTVVLLAMAGLRADSWAGIPPRHLYYIVRALKAVNMEPEARMIAAEAVTRG